VRIILLFALNQPLPKAGVVSISRRSRLLSKATTAATEDGRDASSNWHRNEACPSGGEFNERLNLAQARGTAHSSRIREPAGDVGRHLGGPQARLTASIDDGETRGKSGAIPAMEVACPKNCLRRCLSALREAERTRSQFCRAYLSVSCRSRTPFDLRGLEFRSQRSQVKKREGLLTHFSRCGRW
jgi:hypothetical protein